MSKVKSDVTRGANKSSLAVCEGLRLSPYLCDYEGRQFKNKQTLRLHILMHRKFYRIKCEVW